MRIAAQDFDRHSRNLVSLGQKVENVHVSSFVKCSKTLRTLHFLQVVMTHGSYDAYLVESINEHSRKV